MPNGIEREEGTNPLVRDNDIFADTAKGARLFVRQLYRNVLKVEGDKPGVDFWTQQLTSGRTRAQVAERFIDFVADVPTQIALSLNATLLGPNANAASIAATRDLARSSGASAAARALVNTPVGAAYLASLTNAQFVDSLYLELLGRAGDSGGRSYWLSRLVPSDMNRLDLLEAFLSNPEFGSSVRSRAFVREIYRGLLVRSSEEDGLLYWARRTSAEGQVAITEAFLSSQEYRGRFAQ